MDESSLFWLETNQLTRPQFSAWRHQIAEYEAQAMEVKPRTYVGYPQFSLPKPKPQRLLGTNIEITLSKRRSAATLLTRLPTEKQLGRLLWYAHGAHLASGEGPTPSAGSLQTLELYLVVFPPLDAKPDLDMKPWLPFGLYHYDRVAHALSQIRPTLSKAQWTAQIPALELRQGGCLAWILVGDGARATTKYGSRGFRFLLLEAGHLMQNLCLLSTYLGASTIPLGGFFETEIATACQLLPSDQVLYTGVFGFL